MNSEEIRGQAAEDDATEAAVLSRLLSLHPTLLTFEELLREVGDRPGEFAAGDSVSLAVQDLIAAGLLHRAEGLLVPSRAALRFDELLGDRSAG